MSDDDKRPGDSKQYHAREGSVPYKIHAALVASNVLALIGRRAQARYSGSGNTIDAARVRRRLWSGGTTGSLFPVWAKEDGTEDLEARDQSEGIAQVIHQELLSDEVVRLVSERTVLTEGVVRGHLNALLGSVR
jgi:hypothetical protein